jgi:hypothetical protein
MEEVLLFLEFGLILNVFIGIVDFILNIISASKIGIYEAMKVQELWFRTWKIYRELKKKYEPISLFFELFSIFIPFYYCWRVISKLIYLRKHIPYFTLSTVLYLEEIEKIKNKYLI